MVRKEYSDSNEHYEYLLERNCSNSWTEVENLEVERSYGFSLLISSSVTEKFIYDCLFTADGYHRDENENHFADTGGKARCKFPFALFGHSINAFGKNKIIICGGTYVLENKRSIWVG